MIIPYRCDAPLYHRPWGTIGLIGANVLVMVLWLSGAMSAASYEAHWILNHENWAIHQLLTSSFAHADLGHLLGNMIFLWVFGLIIEGKLGWLRFMAVYAALAIIPNVIESILMDEGGSLGASTAIYGLMTMALFWAPRNEISIFMMIYFRKITFEAAVWMVVGFYVAWDMIAAFLLDFTLSTPLLHVLGVVVGAPLAVLMLKCEWVDCEDWDLLTLIKKGGPANQGHKDRLERIAMREQEERIRQQELREARQACEKSLDKHLTNGHFDLALRVIDDHRKKEPDWQPLGSQLMYLVDGLWSMQAWDDMERIARSSIRFHPDLRNDLELRLACLAIEVRQQPIKGLNYLASVDIGQLSDGARQRVQVLKDQAAEQRANSTPQVDQKAQLGY